MRQRGIGEEDLIVVILSLSAVLVSRFWLPLAALGGACFCWEFHVSVRMVFVVVSLPTYLDQPNNPLYNTCASRQVSRKLPSSGEGLVLQLVVCCGLSDGCILLCACMCVCVCECVCVRVRACVRACHARMRACVHVCTWMCVCVCVIILSLFLGVFVHLLLLIAVACSACFQNTCKSQVNWEWHIVCVSSLVKRRTCYKPQNPEKSNWGKVGQK